ncbi:ferritin subunit-like [Diorhabda carinulata]|uniref:ferritin subunit-like n=1 Tax=Diorhabda carinulata TaxID=1163345 RepID=UPI0025A22AA5|nr:ferritin subunit-like [Diorhabda carinulata]
MSQLNNKDLWSPSPYSGLSYKQVWLYRNENKQTVFVLSPPITSWDSGVSALKDALKLEATVTKKIRDVIRVCEDATNYNDYHLVDYLTGDFLEEQYHGQRDIAGKVSNLEKLMASHGKLGEWLFDKKLQGLDIV